MWETYLKLTIWKVLGQKIKFAKSQLLRSYNELGNLFKVKNTRRIKQICCNSIIKIVAVWQIFGFKMVYYQGSIFSVSKTIINSSTLVFNWWLHFLEGYVLAP